jgi:hypothetical protein
MPTSEPQPAEPQPVVAETEPEPEPEPEPEAESEPEPTPVPSPPKLVAVAALPEPPHWSAEPDPAPFAAAEPEPSPVATLTLPVHPQEWNVWEIERLARERSGVDLVRDEEWGYLLIYLREFASPDGLLPLGFDALVRESFGELVAGRAR